MAAVACGGGTIDFEGPGDTNDEDDPRLSSSGESSSGASGTSGGGTSSGASGGASSGASGGASSGASGGASSGNVEDPIRAIDVDLIAEFEANAPAAPSSLGFASADDAYDNDSSWRFSPSSTAAANQKFELHIQLTAAANDQIVSPAIAQIHQYLGDVTLADLESIKVHSRRNDAAITNDFTMLVYTEPHADAANNDASWYQNRLHAEFVNAADLANPAETWNEFSTEAGPNRLQFWDYRDANTGAGVAPNNNFFTLETLQAGPVTPEGVPDARDYRTQKIKYLTFSTFSGQAFDGSLDGIEIVLKDGRGVRLNLTGDAKVRRFSVSHPTILNSAPPSAGSTHGAADTTQSFRSGSSWHHTQSGAQEKFELHIFGDVGADNGAAWSDLRDFLGAVTLGQLAGIEARSRRNDAASAEFGMLIYTKPIEDGTNDAGWFGRRLHAEFDQAVGLANPAEAWNLFSTAAGANRLTFWDYRDANIADGIAPNNNRFTLADITGGEVTPAGVDSARDYRDDEIKYLTFSTFTGQTVDANLDDIRIKLADGKVAILDLDR